jgi:hypothetical protein
MLEIASILLNLNLSNSPSIDSHLELSSPPIRIAHEVRTSQEVGGTIHIEPNDRPIAGKQTTIWIALTRRGGELIPYSKCNCRLEVRSLSDRNIRFTVANPLAIIERYLGLPSMTVTFPQIGRYELKLSGSSRDSEDFSPFELIFTTNVGK